MSQMTDFKISLQEAKKLHLSWRARALIFIFGAPTIFLFAVLGKLDLVWPSIVSLGMISIAVWVKWTLRRYAWFWITIAVIAIFHLSLIVFVPWPAAWVPAVLMTVISTADFLLILWVLVAIERIVRHPSRQ